MARATNGNRDGQPPYDPLRAIVTDIILSAAKANDITFFRSEWGAGLCDFMKINPEAAIETIRNRLNGNGNAG